MIHGHCSDPDDDCGVSIDEEEIVPQKATPAEQKPRKRSKKRRLSSTSSVESTPTLRPLTQTVAEVRSPYYSDSSPHHIASTQSSASGSSGGEQFKPRYISNTEELNKLVRLLEPHS